jgi:hypothetical protein
MHFLQSGGLPGRRARGRFNLDREAVTCPYHGQSLGVGPTQKCVGAAIVRDLPNCGTSQGSLLPGAYLLRFS